MRMEKGAVVKLKKRQENIVYHKSSEKVSQKRRDYHLCQMLLFIRPLEMKTLP